MIPLPLPAGRLKGIIKPIDLKPEYYSPLEGGRGVLHTI